MSHTPGPWTLVIAIGSRSGTYRGNYEIAEAIDSEHDANARLIAAAPDLLEQLMECIRELENHSRLYDGSTDVNVQMTIRDARIAIAKATGEPQ